jgi:hypothetical protein
MGIVSLPPKIILAIELALHHDHCESASYNCSGHPAFLDGRVFASYGHYGPNIGQPDTMVDWQYDGNEVHHYGFGGGYHVPWT